MPEDTKTDRREQAGTAADGHNQAADPHLQPEQHQEAEERTSPSASVVHEAIRREGDEELKRPSAALAWSGLAAGLSMGFSLIAEGLLQTYLPNAPWRILIVRLGYTVGYVIVILGRQQLFTENTLTPILPLLTHKDVKVMHVLRLWVVVLLSNLVGAFAVTWLIAHSGVFAPDVKQAFAAISAESIRGTFVDMLVQGVFAGWLIALIVWLLPFAETARFFVIVFVAYVVGLGGFAHIVAGSVETFYSVTTGTLPCVDYLTRFFTPTLLGNIFGGVALVALISHAQVVAGKAERGDEVART